VRPAVGEAATSDIDPTHKSGVNFTFRMRLRATSCCTPVDFWPRIVPPKTVTLVTQLTRPKSRLAEIGERRILLYAGAWPQRVDGSNSKTRLN
jgi:hypothetical protein